MPEFVEIKPADLVIDEINPRLAEPNAGQREAQRALSSELGRKVLVLAKSIVEHGLNPLMNYGVASLGDGRYVALDGNRRLLALKALENPDLLADSLPSGILKEIRKLSRRYQESPIEFVQCAIIEERTKLDHWIELMHTGENEGAGTVRWGPDESARFKARSGKATSELQVLDFLTKRGDLSAEERKQVNTSTLRRLIEHPDVRKRLGIELINKKLYILGDEGKVAKALKYVASNLPPVREVDRKEDRVRYANNLPARIVVKPNIESGKGTALSDIVTNSSEAKGKGRTTRPTRSRREKLIPYDCVIKVTAPRIRDIERELRRLQVEKYPNAVSVLLRVFIELSVDEYITRENLPGVTENNHLDAKLQHAVNDLVKHQKLRDQQAKPVRRACQRDSFLLPSVDLMHNYIHNQYTFPVPGDLIAHWDSLQPFLAAIWST